MQFHFSNAMARIRDGFTAAQARADLEQLAAGYERRYPNGGPFGIRMEPLLNEVTGRSRDVIWLLVAAGGLVLLVAFAQHRRPVRRKGGGSPARAGPAARARRERVAARSRRPVGKR